MLSARYGRMKLGHCVTKNFGYVGCSVDVIGHVDSVCSGRRSCQFLVPDETMRDLRPCPMPKELASFLEASYVCVPVAVGTSVQCTSYQSIPISVPPSGSGYLSSSVTDQTGHGSSHCPWLIRAAPGQRIGLALLEFTGTPNSGSGGSSDVDGATSSTQNNHDERSKASADTDSNEVERHRKQLVHRCVQLAVVREARNQLNGDTVVCSRSVTSSHGGAGRERSIYLSTGHQLEVLITRHVVTAPGGTQSSQNSWPNFLLRYDAIGCPTPTAPPAGGWMQLTDNDVIVTGCNDTSLTHVRRQLRCEGTKWTGEFINCTSALAVMKDNSRWLAIQGDWSSPLGILVVSAIGVLLGLIVGVALLFVVIVFLKRRRESCLEANPAEYGLATTAPDIISDDDADASSFAVIRQTATPSSRRGVIGGGGCFKQSSCDECNKLELVALQAAAHRGAQPPSVDGSGFYGAVWPPSSGPLSADGTDYSRRSSPRSAERKYRFVMGPVDGSADLMMQCPAAHHQQHVYESPTRGGTTATTYFGDSPTILTPPQMMFRGRPNVCDGNGVGC